MNAPRLPLAAECRKNFTGSQEKVTENWCLSDPSFVFRVYYIVKGACCAGKVPIFLLVGNAVILAAILQM